MEFITGKHISRRTMLRGMGATISVPLLDAMVPARRLWASTSAAASANATRLVCIEQVHGAAGCNELGASLNTRHQLDLLLEALQHSAADLASQERRA